MFYRVLIWVLLVTSFTAQSRQSLYEEMSQFGTFETPENARLDELFYGDTEIGFMVTSGNTQSTALKLKANIYQDFEHWRNQFKFDSLLKKDKDSQTGESQTSAQRYFASAQGNYKLGDEDASFFVYSDYEKDKFSGYDFQTSLSSGYGNRLYKSEKNSLDFDIGPGVNYQKTASHESQSGFLLRLSLQWQRIISQRTRFNQVLSSEKSLSGLNSRLKSETALISQINNDLALKFSYLYRYNSLPEENKNTFDSETSATIVYNFH